MHTSSPLRTLHRLAVFTTVVCLVLQLAGGWVHATGASLACPDWPLCHGQVFPPMVGGILYEHGHRLLALLLVCLIAGLVFVVFRLRPSEPVLRRVVLGLVGIVALQSTLGGLTVLLRLPPAVSTAHLALSQVLFVSLLFLVLHTRRRPALFALRAGHRRRLLFAAVATFSQEVLGALVRHLGAGLACGMEFPECRGRFLPVDGLSFLQVSHRVAGFALAFLLVWACLPLLVAGVRGRLVACVVGVVLVAQIALGIGSVATGLAPVLVTLHLGGGALLLALSSGAYMLSCAADEIEALQKAASQGLRDAAARG